MNASSSGRETPASFGTPQRHSTIRARPQQQSETTNVSDSTETPKRSEDSSSASAISNVDMDVRRQTNQTGYYRDAWHNGEQRGGATLQAESSRTSQLLGHQHKVSLPSNLSAEESSPATKRLSAKPQNGDYSPPLTGKDSAYSSVSGASAMLPGFASPRSVSSTSSRQTAQFGLFPSRNLSTPKGSISSRLGASSPAFDRPEQHPKPVDIPNRPPTSLSTFSDASTKRLSKRSSFTSLKRLFTKKKSGDIGPIAE
ncbi:hypothetical protein IG631_02454 [Alternaria alternata]|nr:hypothetical protein IG631_02454 [Alternaria alternata]